ncbi:hypothetical protein HMPREF3101_11420 [Corynebacterium sp. HMSC29G08]|nr:hypothetical protein HMPREF3101_11420 [Corynebacterium sp. HMSC29G08]
MPWIVVWDDHEVANNFWAEGADNHQAEEGDFIERRDAAIRAYYEWMPVRTTEPSAEGHIYRTFTFGDLVGLTVMDLRTYRDVEFWKGGSRQLGDARSMLGADRGRVTEDSRQQHPHQRRQPLYLQPHSLVTPGTSLT